jgi:RHS repeat-associated protein
VPATNRVSSATENNNNTTNFTYDNAGNMTAANSTTYQWDAANRLKSVNNGSLGSYGYDGNGKRVKKTESGVTTYYVISSVLGSVLEVTSAGVQRAYVMSGNAVVAQLNPNGSFYWLHLDHLGSGRKMTDTSGTMVYRAEFDPYGKLLYEWSSPTNLNTKKFTGYERDGATNLDYAQARMYGSEWGRFLSPDPGGVKTARLDSPKTLNRYAYTAGNPVNFIDPNGTDYWDPDWYKFYDYLCGMGFDLFCSRVSSAKSPGSSGGGGGGAGADARGGGIVFELPDQRRQPRLNITVTLNGVTRGEGCGESEYHIGWSIDSRGGDRAAIFGYVIQHVWIEWNKVDSQGRKAPFNNYTREYWEAWDVVGGVVYPRLGNTNDVFYQISEGPETIGNYTKYGRAIFVSTNQISYDPSTWGNQVPEAGSLLSTYNKPQGWSDASGVRHDITVFWNCLGGRREQTVTTNP